MKNIGTLSLVALALATVSASAEEKKTGYFIDAPVTGLYYQTDSNISGITDKGAYQYNDGDVVTFYLGNDDNAMVLASISGQKLVTPTLATTTPSRSVNMTRLLLSLDTTPENREEILLASKALSDPEFQKQLKNINLEYLDTHSEELQFDLVSVKDAAKHLNESQNYIRKNFTSKEIIFEPLNKVLIDDVVSRRGWRGNLCFFDMARIDEKGYYGPVGSLKYKLTMDGIYTYPSTGDYFGTEEPNELVASCNLNSEEIYTEIEFEEVPDYEEWGGILACAKTGCTRNDLNGFSIEDFDDEGDWKYRTVAMNYDEKTGLIMQKTQGLGPKDTVPHLNRREFLWLSSSNPKLRNIDISGFWQVVNYTNLSTDALNCLYIEDGQVKKTISHSGYCPQDSSLYTEDATKEFQDMWWLHGKKNIASLAQLNTPVKWYEDGKARYTSWEYLPAGENWDQGLLHRFDQKVTVDSNGIQQVETLNVSELRKVIN